MMVKRTRVATIDYVTKSLLLIGSIIPGVPLT
jgi:hypothetical protein